MNLRPRHLRCEYLIEPRGIDRPRPRLSWELEDERRGVQQRAYEIEVASSAEALETGNADLWRSSRVESGESAQVAYDGQPLASRARCFWRVRVWDESGNVSAWSATACWTMGLLRPEDWSARWIGLDEAEPAEWTPATPRYLRASFDESDCKRATLYVTALGLYDIRINNRPVGDRRLTPEWTNYHNRVQYQTHDVTGLMKRGENRLLATLGNGWYCGGWQHWESKLRPIYGTRPYLLLQLEIEQADGTVRRVVSDGSWQGTTNGPMRFSGIYEGETFDARKRLSDAAWQPVHVGQPKAGPLVSQRSEPIRVTQEIAAVAITQPQPGVWIFDFGQNVVGVCRLRVNEAAGVTIMLKHNEVLNPDGTLYTGNLHAGHLSTGDRQVVRYTCLGEGEETYEPTFTYQGFRYVEVTGLTAAPTPETLAARVFHTDFAKAGDFECSNPLVNRLVQNIQWSQRGNSMGVPTDCPQRDERCGYTGDANFFMGAAVYNFDIAAFFNKWLVDVCEDSQRADGGFADHAPDYGKGGSQNVGWSDAGILCPYRIYRTYGDVDVIRQHYDAMRRNMDMQRATSHGFVRDANHVGLGDWLNLGGGASKEVIGTAYFGHCCRVMAEMAGVIGNTADAGEFETLAGNIAKAFADRFILPDGSIRDSSQTGYALAFRMGMVPADCAALVAQRFAEEIARFGGGLATGFIGTPHLLPALHLAGRDDLACQLLLREEFPSWLFPVKQGATTIWERWDSLTPTGFADPDMNSFNHYAFGSVGEYLFAQVGGISELEPGYRRVLIAPVVHAAAECDLTWADTRYQSIRGMIRSAWRVDGPTVHLAVTIPPNTSAVVRVPTRHPESITESHQPLGDNGPATVASRSPASVDVVIGSGEYAFAAQR